MTTLFKIVVGATLLVSVACFLYNLHPAYALVYGIVVCGAFL